jgi:hypothetical protein
VQINDDMAAYLNGLGASNVVWSAVSDALALYDELLPPGVVDAIFITQTVDSSGQTVLTNLWLYGDTVLAEIFGFLRTPKKFDVMKAIDVLRCEFEVAAYIPGQTPTPDSRFSLDFSLGRGNLAGKMSAVGDNCTALHAFYTRILMPQMSQTNGASGA